MMHVAFGILAFDCYLTHVTDIEHSHMFANSLMLRGNASIVDRHLKASERRYQGL
jgi:hypothetical protein